MSNSDLIGTADAAGILGKDIATLNRWARAGIVTPAYQGTGRTAARLYRRRDIERLAVKLGRKAAS